MTNPAVLKFWEAIQQDEKLKSDMWAIDQEGNTGEALGRVVELAAGAGFVFTAEEYRTAVEEQMVHVFPVDEGALSEDELSSVAGGTGVIGRISLPLPRGALGYGMGIK